MLHHYDHRFSTYEGRHREQLNKGTLPRLSVERHQDAAACPMPRYWVPERRCGHGWPPGADAGLGAGLAGHHQQEQRTHHDLRGGPAHGFGHKFMLALAREAALLAGVWSSFVLDSRGPPVGRRDVHELLRGPPAPRPRPRDLARHAGFLLPRLTELIYTTPDLGGFARELGDTGPPSAGDPDRRALLQAELDAFFFHLYGVTRDDTAYVLDTFNVTRDNDVKEYGRYRTKDLVLAAYDRMAAAGLTPPAPLLVDGETYTSTLTPPPGDGPVTPPPERSAHQPG